VVYTDSVPIPNAVQQPALLLMRALLSTLYECSVILPLLLLLLLRSLR